RFKAPKGSTLHFRVRGPDAPDALAAMLSLVERRFDEEPVSPAAAESHERRYKGRPAAPGLAFGPLVVVGEPRTARVGSGDRAAEARELRAAIADALGDLRRLV